MTCQNQILTKIVQILMESKIENYSFEHHPFIYHGQGQAD